MGKKRARDERGRPEAQVGSGQFYDAAETARYSSAAERTGIQRDLTERSLHLLYSLTRWDGRPRLLADIGCGAGASSSVARRCGHRVIGLDVSLSMLAAGEPHEEAVCWEMGRGLPFRDGVQLDGAISISALQWLCSDVLEPKLRLLLSHLHSSLRPGAAAVAQFYPGSPAETARLVRCAAEAGWAADGGGAAAVYDLPHANRSSRLFLCLERGEGEVGSNKGAHGPPASQGPKEHPAHPTHSLRLCPCAWPHPAACALQLHLRAGAFNDVLAERLASGAPGATSDPAMAVARACEAWEQRLHREHALLAKKMQHELQLLWKELPEPRVKEAKARLRRCAGGADAEALGVAGSAAGSATSSAAGSEAMVAVSEADGLLKRRSRLEAWWVGAEKAKTRHMQAAWEEAVAAGLDALAADAEAELRRMHSLPCFAATDLYLCRPKGRRVPPPEPPE